ncbi:hypothetical protein G6F65_019742 [Rhizopus arrhizus]|nr:hypothetical protein G6F65_019742 [Rhizopus arrhizus]
MDLLDGHRAHAGPRGDRHGREDGQVDQQDLREFADAEPDDDQRQVGQRRQRAVELDGRVEDAARIAVHAHQDAHGNRRQAGQEECAEDARQAGQGMLGQGGIGNAVRHGRDELVVDGNGGRQEQRPHPACAGHQEPQGDQCQAGQQADVPAVAGAWGAVDHAGRRGLVPRPVPRHGRLRARRRRARRRR